MGSARASGPASGEATGGGERKPGRFKASDLVTYGAVALAVWLGWHIAKAPIALRAPPALAIRIAPTSPEVLRRAAEAELSAGRAENAKVLAEESLSRAPFNARALRVQGLAQARLGDATAAQDVITLAGNWSLRDDPAHAWLVERGLRRGNYGSAFAHADTLARRRAEVHPQVFRLFTTAAAQDSRAVAPLVRLLAERPPWRAAYLEHLHQNGEGAAVAAALAVGLQQTKAPLTRPELQRLYTKWAEQSRFAGLRWLTARLGQPSAAAGLHNGDFKTPLDDQLYPFGWRLLNGPGISSLVLPDEAGDRGDALRVEYDGFGSGRFVEQLLLLQPGVYRLSGSHRLEFPVEDSRQSWSVSCVGSGVTLASFRPSARDASTEWSRFTISFSVPAQNCDAQWIRLDPTPADRRTTIVSWYDDIAISRQSARGAA